MATASDFQLASWLWKPQRRGIEQTIELLNSNKGVCLYAPTGGGKLTCAAELLRWASYQGVPSAFYVNRKLLVGQSYSRLTSMGLDVGVRSAEYGDLERMTAMVQICSSDSERERVYKRKKWQLHDAGLVVVDEAHMQKASTMTRIINDYKAMGALIVLMTATPLGISHFVDELVVSGTMSDYRECGALVMAVTRSIEQPDMSKVQRNKTGEYILDGRKKKIFTQQIVGNVIDRWKKYNPDARPMLLYAPGKPESVWFCKQFCDIGVRVAHIDANEIVIDGKRYNRSRALWDELVEQFKDGEIKGICSRFVLREGVDLPFAYHCCLATPIGSMTSYVQVVGRIIRRSAETPDEVLITDHGGNYHRHGSPNATRPWRDWWKMSEEQVSSYLQRERRETGEREPIRCPKCETERPGGTKCPVCGFEHERSVRHVIMVDGTMKVVEGKLDKKVRTQHRSDTEKKWVDMFWAWRRSKNTQTKTMAQLEGFFTLENGYHPPRDLPFMPKHYRDFHQRVSTVDFSLLNPGR